MKVKVKSFSPKSQLFVLESEKMTENYEQMENVASVPWGEKKERKNKIKEKESTR